MLNAACKTDSNDFYDRNGGMDLYYIKGYNWSISVPFGCLVAMLALFLLFLFSPCHST